MKLALKFIDNNPYARCGVFIKNPSPIFWLQEIKRMQLSLSDCTAYACPGLEANRISGVLLILKSAQKNIEVGNNSCVQKAHTNFFIPENTELNMALTDEEFSKLLNGIPHFFHHEFGLIELKEILDWSSIIQNPTAQFPTIETPSKGVTIPTSVNAFSIEIEEEEAAEALENPFGTEEVNPEEVPFDMKKVLEGNNAEIDKYLAYLEKNPEAALKMAIPLDMMGTSRGKAFAKYKFKSNFFESLGFGDSIGNIPKSIRLLFVIITIMLLCWIGYEILNAVKETRSNDEIEHLYEDVELTNDLDVAYTDSGNSTTPEETQPITENNSLQNTLLIIAIVVFALLIWYLVRYRKGKARKMKLEKQHSWLDLPDESELFDLNEDVQDNKSAFYFGGDEVSFRGKIIIFIALLGLIVYLFYPIINKGGFSLVFGIFAGITVIRMLYTLLNKNRKFDGDDE
jgi:hypothetical protein